MRRIAGIVVVLICFSMLFHAAGSLWADDGAELIAAAKAGNVPRVKALLDRGANVNAKDEDGLTALYCSAAEGHRDVAELLISRGADVNARSKDGFTALHVAAYEKHKAVVELLLSKGADISLRNDAGYTPSRYVRSGEIAALLLAARRLDVRRLVEDPHLFAEMQRVIEESRKAMAALGYPRKRRFPVPIPVRPGRGPLNSVQASWLACYYANCHVERHRGLRPFKPDTFKIVRTEDKWVWGEYDPMGVKGYSAIVSFNLDGTDLEMTVFLPVGGFDF